jgi:intracellular septation protein
MKQLFEFFPILLFFIVYKLYDIYIATAVLIPATILLVLFSWFKYRKIETMQWVTLVLVLVMGTATILLHDVRFIKWKLSIIEWLFGLAFLGSQFIGSKTFYERMMSSMLKLPDYLWRRLNLIWGFFFMSVGFINVYVIYHFTTDEWVIFKTFIVPGLLFIFIMLQMVFIYKYIPETEE